MQFDYPSNEIFHMFFGLVHKNEFDFAPSNLTFF